jgi:hypothetical protein
MNNMVIRVRWVAGDPLLLLVRGHGRPALREAFEHGLLHIAKLIFPEGTL